MFQSIQYTYPNAAYLLLIIPALLAILLYYLKFRRDTLGVLGLKGDFLPSNFPQVVGYLSLLFSLCFAIFALMGPKGNPHYTLKENNIPGFKLDDEEKAQNLPKVHEIIFLLDTSLSMSVEDTRKGVSRLQNAKEIIDVIISKLEGESVAVNAFTSQIVPIVPPTYDYLFARLMLRNITINEGNTSGTNFTKIFSQLRKKWEYDSPEKSKTVIFLSDGDDTHLDEVSLSKKMKVERAIETAVENLTAQNVVFFTIAMGTKKGGIIPNFTYEGQKVQSGLDESILKKIAQAGNGDYYLANDETPAGLASEILSKIRETLPQEIPREKQTAIKEESKLIYDLYFQYPLFIAIVFLFLGLFLPKFRWTLES
ncbi:MAG: hypothetical protein Tsb0021_09970 [Chlamydiales bacterium]